MALTPGLALKQSKRHLRNHLFSTQLNFTENVPISSQSTAIFSCLCKKTTFHMDCHCKLRGDGFLRGCNNTMYK